MKTQLINIIKFILSVFKPDFRKTVGWLFISSGLVALAPPFIHEILINLLSLVNLQLVKHLEHTDTVGALMICIGVLYHLLYIADQKEVKRLEIVIGVLIIISCTFLVLLTM